MTITDWAVQVIRSPMLPAQVEDLAAMAGRHAEVAAWLRDEGVEGETALVLCGRAEEVAMVAKVVVQTMWSLGVPIGTGGGGEA